MYSHELFTPGSNRYSASQLDGALKAKQLIVKFLHRGYPRGRTPEGLLRQFPHRYTIWDSCHFDFNHDCKDYDWLVVYHDLPASSGIFTEEKLKCPKKKTILVTGEPSTITVFGRDYLRQFGCILSFQEPWVMNHDRVIYHHPGLTWHYGLKFNGGKHIDWDTIAATPPMLKNRSISTMCSARKGKLTLHNQRVAFTRQLKKDLPELDIYGHGVKPLDDKAAALDSYSFHIVVENHVYHHHITEKLPDAFLGYTLPFYHGAPNAGDYFPKDSFIPIDISNYGKTLDIIRSHLRNNEYHDRLPYIMEARRRVLEEQNLFAILSRTINVQEENLTGHTTDGVGGVIRNRKTMRIKNPMAGLRSLIEKGVVKGIHRLQNLPTMTRKTDKVTSPTTQYI